jgi:hypothetical protein
MGRMRHWEDLDLGINIVVFDFGRLAGDKFIKFNLPPARFPIPGIIKYL